MDDPSIPNDTNGHPTTSITITNSTTQHSLTPTTVNVSPSIHLNDPSSLQHTTPLHNQSELQQTLPFEQHRTPTIVSFLPSSQSQLPNTNDNNNIMNLPHTPPLQLLKNDNAISKQIESNDFTNISHLIHTHTSTKSDLNQHITLPPQSSHKNHNQHSTNSFELNYLSTLVMSTAPPPPPPQQQQQHQQSLHFPQSYLQPTLPHRTQNIDLSFSNMLPSSSTETSPSKILSLGIDSNRKQPPTTTTTITTASLQHQSHYQHHFNQHLPISSQPQQQHLFPTHAAFQKFQFDQLALHNPHIPLQSLPLLLTHQHQHSQHDLHNDSPNDSEHEQQTHLQRDQTDISINDQLQQQQQRPQQQQQPQQHPSFPQQQQQQQPQQHLPLPQQQQQPPQNQQDQNQNQNNQPQQQQQLPRIPRYLENYQASIPYNRIVREMRIIHVQLFYLWLLFPDAKKKPFLNNPSPLQILNGPVLDRIHATGIRDTIMYLQVEFFHLYFVLVFAPELSKVRFTCEQLHILSRFIIGNPTFGDNITFDYSILSEIPRLFAHLDETQRGTEATLHNNIQIPAIEIPQSGTILENLNINVNDYIDMNREQFITYLNQIFSTNLTYPYESNTNMTIGINFNQHNPQYDISSLLTYIPTEIRNEFIEMRFGRFNLQPLSGGIIPYTPEELSAKNGLMSFGLFTRIMSRLTTLSIYIDENNQTERELQEYAAIKHILHEDFNYIHNCIRHDQNHPLNHPNAIPLHDIISTVTRHITHINDTYAHLPRISLVNPFGLTTRNVIDVSNGRPVAMQHRIKSNNLLRGAKAIISQWEIERMSQCLPGVYANRKDWDFNSNDIGQTLSIGHYVPEQYFIHPQRFLCELNINGFNLITNETFSNRIHHHFTTYTITSPPDPILALHTYGLDIESIRNNHSSLFNDDTYHHYFDLTYNQDNYIHGEQRPPEPIIDVPIGLNVLNSIESTPRRISHFVQQIDDNVNDDNVNVNDNHHNNVINYNQNNNIQINNNVQPHVIPIHDNILHNNNINHNNNMNIIDHDDIEPILNARILNRLNRNGHIPHHQNNHGNNNNHNNDTNNINDEIDQTGLLRNRDHHHHHP